MHFVGLHYIIGSKYEVQKTKFWILSKLKKSRLCLYVCCLLI